MTSERPPDEDLDPGSLDEIEADECWRLLATQPIGRVGVIVGHYPLIFPVNYAVDGKQIVLQGEAKFSTWLYRIATNRCLRELRRRRAPTLELPEVWRRRRGSLILRSRRPRGWPWWGRDS